MLAQTTIYGADHKVVLGALAAIANTLVFAEKDEAYLRTLADIGVNGVQFKSVRRSARCWTTTPTAPRSASCTISAGR